MGILIYDKPFKTYKEQIDYLKNRYHLAIFDEPFAEYVLSTHSYYDIINGYQECMMVDGKFREGISIEYLYFFHLFDKNFRNILFKNILIIENAFKTSLAYTLSEQYGVDMNDYLDESKFKPNYKGLFTFRQIKKRILKEIGITDNYDNFTKVYKEPTKHYFLNHNHIPAWILMKNVSFDNAINLYCLTKKETKESITNSIIQQNVPYEDKVSFLTASLHLLRTYRNIIAHNLKFVAYKQNKYILPFHTTNAILNEPALSKDITQYDDIYACILAIYIIHSQELGRLSLLSDIHRILTTPEGNVDVLRPMLIPIRNDYFSVTQLGDSFIDRLDVMIRKLVSR